MRRRGIAFAAAALVLAGAAPEAAAQRTGTRMGRNAMNTQRDAYTLLGIIGECLAQRRPELVRRWLNMLPGSREELALLDAQEGDFDVCASDDQFILGGGRELLYTPRRLRVPAALATVRRSIGRAPERSPLPADSDPWFVPALNALPSGSTIDRGSLLAQEFGHCVAVTDWANARALLAAREGSSQEGGAFEALRPVLAGCVPQGLRLEITPKALREYLAEPFYHVMTAAPGAGRG
ncbi:MAG TPA: hypothetical protein VGW40_09845 [Allosphingosinicella sp.]|nr:hypothetical protein [Allosphingosinicella sp.]